MRLNYVTRLPSRQVLLCAPFDLSVHRKPVTLGKLKGEGFVCCRGSSSYYSRPNPTTTLFTSMILIYFSILLLQNQFRDRILYHRYFLDLN